MKKLIPHLMNANGQLDGSADNINRAVGLVNKEIAPKYHLQNNIDVIFSTGYLAYAIQEMGVGGYTYKDDLVAIEISDKHTPSFDDIFSTLCHELAHAARWQTNDEYSKTLLDTIIFEGLGTCAEIQAVKDTGAKTSYFEKSITSIDRRQLERLEQSIKPHLDEVNFNRREIMFDGDGKNLPRWAGYILGYHAVKEYLITSSSIIYKAYARPYKSIKDTLGLLH